MASSSSFASNCPRWKYDVFVSFRGEDTRKIFVSHLYNALRYRGILIFQNNKRLDDGDSISEELIKESQVALVVFSKNYATSTWCLNELVKIMECKKENGQTVIPVFYGVDPAEVRNQRESFAEAFSKHESKYKDDVEGMQKVKKWRTALTEAANLKGYDIRQRDESLGIQEIVDQISSKLGNNSSSYLKDVVGINTHFEKLLSLLELGVNDVRIVGIWGMGGIGKTTIARAFLDAFSCQFEASCFIAAIKENKYGMHSLQNILLSELLMEKANYVNNKEDGKHMIARRLRFKKVLVVLDDIDHIDHLDYLAGNLNWCGGGSRIIATTRNKHLMGKNDIVYEVPTLVDCQAIQLFNQYAFKGEVPDKSFEKLTLEVVSHADGLPLALKVWGSFLHKRDITEWRSAIEDMKMNSKSEVVEKLKISFDRLETTQRAIFLDIACFFRGKEKDYIMHILESCYSGASIGLSVLIDKSLVFISENDRIEMHDLIQDMGRYVVKIQKDLGEQSILWDAKDFEEVIVNNIGTKAMEAIWIEDYIQKLCFSKKAMKNMKRLRMLNISGGFYTHDESIEYLPNSLRYFGFYKYPWESLPENFEPKRLVHLDLQDSSLRHLWIGRKHLRCLRKLDLSYSRSLIRTPDFTGMPNLEYVELTYCQNLEEVHHSLEYSTKLISLDLSCCVRLEKFPYVNVESLEYLALKKCSSLEKFPEMVGRMKQTHITKFDLSSLKNLATLPSSICKLKSLVRLNVSGCEQLESLPEEIGDLKNLEELDAKDTLISKPPASIVRLNKLTILKFGKHIEEIFGDEIGDSEGVKDDVYFVFPQVNEGLRSLKLLDLSFCNLINGGLPEDIGCLSSLDSLNLSGNNFDYLPQSMAQLCSLRFLDLSGCKWLKELPDFMGMPNLETLNLSNCMNLEEVDLPLEFLTKLTELELTNCKRLERFPDPSSTSQSKRTKVAPRTWDVEDFKEEMVNDTTKSTVEGSESVTSSSSMHETMAGRLEGDVFSESVKVIRLHGTGLKDPDDGFSWRKYGSKEIPGSKYPRTYFECTHMNVRGCSARKKVQRSDDDPLTFEVTYSGTHSCGRHLESSYQKITRIFRTVYMLVKVIRAMKIGWFCSLLPSNYEFDKDTMIQLWVAQGLFDLECGRSMETLANKHFDDMFEKKFILQSRFDMAKGRMKYKVDNVVSTSSYLRVQEAELSSTSEEVQHLLLLSENFDQSTFKTLKRFNKLKTLILFCQHGDSIKRVPYDLFLKLQLLRTLDLHGTNISELPDSISYLSSLHYLDVSETPLRVLPESIGSLQHLQTLKLESCSNFFRLPECTSKLVNLRHLDLDILGQLTSMPVGMGNLTRLQTLKAFILDKGEGSGARELKRLTDLCGSFCISRLENISSSEEAREVDISKKHLNKLELRWESHQDDLALLEEILECLQPHLSLQELQISFYCGSRFPIWMSNSCLSNIVSIILYKCKNCDYLPSLGGLPSLKSLVFYDLLGVRSIDRNFCKYEESQIGPAFPKLEELKIDGMPNLKQWTGVENGDFPCLRRLSVGRCPMLMAIPMLSLLSCLKVLEICECDELQSFPEEKLPSKLEFLIITHCPLIKELYIKPQSEEWSKIEHIPSIFIDHLKMSST